METANSVSIPLDSRVLKQSSAAAGFPQRVMEKGDDLAISPLADAPNRFSPRNWAKSQKTDF